MKNIVLVVGGDAFDLEEVLKRSKRSGNPKRFKGSEVTATDLEEALFGLFAKQEVVIEEAHELKGKALETVMAFIKRPNPEIVLIMQATKKTELSKLVPCVEIGEVKPWEKQAKMADWIISYLKERAIKIQPALANTLAASFGLDRFLLSQELEKLCTYIGDKKEIDAPDCKAISSLEVEESVWIMTEAFLQRDAARGIKILQSLLERGVSAFLLVRSLRSSCHQALEMCALSEAGGHDVAEHFPQLKGKLFEKNFRLAKEAGMSFLTKALAAIDKAEARLKDAPFDESTLLMKLFV